MRDTSDCGALLGVMGEALGMAEDEDLVAAAVQQLRDERRSDPGFDAVWAQQMGDPVPDWLRQGP